jgi:hypothetical protein
MLPFSSSNGLSNQTTSSLSSNQNQLSYQISGVLETARVAAMGVARDRLRARGLEVINLEREAKLRVAGTLTLQATE